MNKFLGIALSSLFFLWGCSNSGEEKKEEKINDIVTQRETKKKNNLVNETEKKQDTFPILDIIPKPKIDWGELGEFLVDTISIKPFDEKLWPYIVHYNHVDVSRYGSHPANIASGRSYEDYGNKQLVYDSVYYYYTDWKKHYSNQLNRVHKTTGEKDSLFLPLLARNSVSEILEERLKDTILSYSHGSIKDLNLWNNKLYFVYKRSILEFDLTTHEYEHIDSKTNEVDQISIIDDQIFYSCKKEGIWVYDLVGKTHKKIIDQPVNWFWMAEDLMFFTDKDNMGYIIDPIKNKKYITHLPFLAPSYFQDRLLFSFLPLPYQGNEGDLRYYYEHEATELELLYCRPFVMHFDEDSLVVLPHREVFLSLLEGNFVGIDRPFDWWDSELACLFRPPFGDNLLGFKPKVKRWWSSEELEWPESSENLFFTGNGFLVYEKYFVKPYVYYDVASKNIEKIPNLEVFLSRDPRAKPPQFEELESNI